MNIYIHILGHIKKLCIRLFVSPLLLTYNVD